MQARTEWQSMVGQPLLSKRESKAVRSAATGETRAINLSRAVFGENAVFGYVGSATASRNWVERGESDSPIKPRTFWTPAMVPREERASAGLNSPQNHASACDDVSGGELAEIEITNAE